MQPTSKNPSIDAMLQSVFGVDRKESISNNTCALCGAVITGASFRDELSLREYTISGMYQKCQDSVFGV